MIIILIYLAILFSLKNIRHLKEIVVDFCIEAMIFHDYSDTLDGALWDTYHRISIGWGQ